MHFFKKFANFSSARERKATFEETRDFFVFENFGTIPECSF